MSSRAILYIVLAAVMAVSWAASCVLYRAAEIGEMIGPIETRSFHTFTVVVVGSGGGYENPERMGPCIAIGSGEQILLVDAGRGIAEGLRSARIPVAQPEALYLSNLLPENTVGLDDLLLTGWRQDRTKPLRVIGPPGTADFIKGILEAHREGIAAEGASLGLAKEGAQIDVRDVTGGWTETVGDITVRAGNLEGGPLPALAWRFENAGHAVVVAATGWAPDDVVSLAAGADLLLHETIIALDPDEAEEAGVLTDPERLRKEAALHTSLDAVGAVAKRARVATLALIRMRPPPFFDFQVTGYVGQDFPGKVIVPQDGDELEF